MAACSKEEPALTGAQIRIAAEIGQSESQPKAQSLTRASETAFAKGDQIGLRVEYGPTLVEHRNACMTHNGKVFTGTRVMWNETAGDAVLSAYYPYDAKFAEVPAIFPVPQNQRTDEAFARADFLAASKSVKVEEFAEPVELKFRHVLSKIIINVTDETEAKDVIDQIVIKNFKHSANIDYANRAAGLNTDAMQVNVSGHKIENLKYEMILVPQKSEEMWIEIYTASNGGVALRYKKRAKNVELKSGFRYKLNITLKDGEGEEVIEFAAAAEVEDWVDGEPFDDTQI